MQDFWGKVQWWWERPPLKRMRTTVSMAQWSVKLPALMALVATQVGLLASQVCACHDAASSNGISFDTATELPFSTVVA